MNYDKGIIRSVHYGDILINYNSVLDVQKNIIPFVTDGTFDKYKHNLLKNGDIIFADAAEDESVGKVVEVYNIGNKNIVAGLHTIVARSRILRGHYFLGYYINSNSYRKQILRLMQGTKISSISKKTLTETKVIIPITIKEQGKIGQLFKTLDDTIALHQDAIQRQQVLKKALLQKLFPVNGEQFPTVRFATFKEEWEQRKVRELFTVTRGQVLAATKTKDKETDEFIYPVYSSQTKNNGLMGFYNQYLFENAITWTTDGANAGTVNFRKGKFYSTNVNGVLLSDKGYANKAISEIINKIAWKHVSKVGNPKLMNNIMSEITIMIPSIEELNKISILFNQIDNTIALHQQALDKLKLLKQSLLQKMFV